MTLELALLSGSRSIEINGYVFLLKLLMNPSLATSSFSLNIIGRFRRPSGM
jgi:hypothetical protein